MKLGSVDIFLNLRYLQKTTEYKQCCQIMIYCIFNSLQRSDYFCWELMDGDEINNEKREIIIDCVNKNRPRNEGVGPENGCIPFPVPQSIPTTNYYYRISQRRRTRVCAN